MYHRLNKVDCLPLEKLNEIARLTLMFVLEREDRRDKDNIELDFLTYFEAHDYPDVGQWLWSRHTIIRKPLLKLLAIPMADKQQVKGAFEADVGFGSCGCMGTMLTAKLEKSDPAFTLVKSVMIAFYESLLRDQKVPGNLVGETADFFDRQSFLGRYLAVQDIKVCPGCDGAPPSRDLYADRIREEVDHFLPKSKYPILAVHPLNLVPLCKTCNKDYKGSRDAMSDDKAAVKDVTALEHIFHPYLRPACDEVDVTVSWCASEAKPKLAILPRDDSATGWARVHSLDYTLSLESRWNGDLEEGRLEEPIKSYLRHSTLYERLNATLDETDLIGRYDKISRIVKTDVGREPGRVPAAAYAAWLVADASANAERARIAVDVFDVVNTDPDFSPRDGLTPPLLF